jgi:hypothetical protein
VWVGFEHSGRTDGADKADGADTFISERHSRERGNP